jgi:aspartyl/glutamyl-tRNA(Asn/Gln) amidotransferase C subunit
VETEKLAPQAEEARLRADEAQPGLERDRVLEQAPDAVKGCFRVPRVIERHDEH